MTVKKVDRKLSSGAGVGDTYFNLAKSLKQKIRDLRDAPHTDGEAVVYLWVCVTRAGLKQGVHSVSNAEHPLSQEQWLNVVDESASLGANWLVLSLADPLSECPHIWELCQWAQQAHGMMVGLHLKDVRLDKADVAAIKKLDLRKTRVLVRKDAYPALQWLEKEGVVLWTANPQPDGERPNCQGPRRMIFVNEKGILYTCGLVEGRHAYRMGHVFDKSLKHIITNPHLPHHVEDDLHIVTPECDGCPSLVANFFDENE